MRAVVSTNAVDVEERRDYWHDVVCDQFVPLEVIPSGIPSGRVEAQSVGDMQLRRIAASAHRFDRTTRLIRQTDEDYYKVVLGLRGSALLVQDDRELVLGAGDLAMYDSSRPYTFVMDRPYDLLVCMLPKRLLSVRATEIQGITATRIDGGAGVGAMVAPFLSDLFSRSDELQAGEQDVLVGTVASLMLAMARGLSGRQAPGNVHLLRARDYIGRHVGDPALSPEAISAAVGISVSYLHKLFAQTDASVAAFVRESRLQGCWRDLGSPSLSGSSISQIAARWGLVDASQFSRLFKLRFGVSPREHRNRSQQFAGELPPVHLDQARS